MGLRTPSDLDANLRESHRPSSRRRPRRTPRLLHRRAGQPRRRLDGRQPARRGVHRPGSPDPAGRPRSCRPSSSWPSRGTRRPLVGRCGPGFNAPARLDRGRRSPRPRDSTAGTSSTPSSPGPGQNLAVHAGPLLDFRAGALPDWIWLWEGDFEAVLGLVVDLVRQAVERYKGKVPRLAPGPPAGQPTSWGCPRRNRSGSPPGAIQVARQTDPRRSSRRGRRPWAEWMGSSPFQLGPLHLADYLVRADLGMAGVVLEIAPGYSPRAATSATSSTSRSCSTSTPC